VDDQFTTGPLEEYADSLASVSLGDKYTDSVSGFSGIATSRIISMSEPEQVLLENDSTSRWIPAIRIHDENSNPVLDTSSSKKKEAVH